MMLILTISFLSFVHAIETPKTSSARTDKLMELWYNMTFDRRDNFMSHIKKVQGDKSDAGSEITEKEYNDLIKLSEQENIPEYIEYDSAGRPPKALRSGELLEACDKLKGQPHKRCEKRFKEIVDFQSDENDEVSDAEFDNFKNLLNSLSSKKK